MKVAGAGGVTQVTRLSPAPLGVGCRGGVLGGRRGKGVQATGRECHEPGDAGSAFPSLPPSPFLPPFLRHPLTAIPSFCLVLEQYLGKLLLFFLLIYCLFIGLHCIVFIYSLIYFYIYFFYLFLYLLTLFI